MEATEAVRLLSAVADGLREIRAEEWTADTTAALKKAEKAVLDAVTEFRINEDVGIVLDDDTGGDDLPTVEEAAVRAGFDAGKLVGQRVRVSRPRKHKKGKKE